MSGPKSPFDILLKINIYDLLSGNLNLSTRLFDFSFNIRIQCMPFGDRRQNTHCDHFVTQRAKMLVALFKAASSSGVPFISFKATPSFVMEVSQAIMMWSNLPLET